MVDLGGYVIILVETHDKKVKLYGSPAEKADLEVADEILEINGQSLDNSNHTDVITHIHNCIKSRTICLRVKRRTGNKLAKELAENSHVQDAFVIAVEQQAKERLERLSALRKIKPVDMTKLSQQLCDSPPASIGEDGATDVSGGAGTDGGTVYSAPMAQLGSTQNLAAQLADSSAGRGAAASTQQAPPQRLQQPIMTASSSQHDVASSAGGYVTDEEIELQHTITPPPLPPPPPASNGQIPAMDPECIKSPSKEVLIGGDNNPSRRSSRSSMANYSSVHGDMVIGTEFLNKSNTSNSLSSNSGGQILCSNGQPRINGAVLQTTKEEQEPNEHKTLKQTNSLKSVVDVSDLLRCLENLGGTLGGLGESGLVESTRSLVTSPEFTRLLGIHNTIQTVQCFQTPPDALCCDARNLVRECMLALQSSPLPEAAEVLDILHQIEFESLFYTHDKLAERQAASPWEQCVAEMWAKDRSVSNVTSNSSAATSAAAPPVGQDESAAATMGGDQLHKTAAANLNSSSKSAAAAAEDNNNTSSSKVAALQRLSSSSSADVTRVVKILKQNEPLGATVRNEGDKVVIGRVVKGGAAERSGQLHPGDEVLEVNGLKLKGKSVHDICDTLCRMTGTLTFVIIPKPAATAPTPNGTLPRNGTSGAATAASILNNLDPDEGPKDQVYHYRAHFSYHPDDDLYIPCHELGISFQRGDILHVINSEDKHWWQAYRDGEWTQTLAGLIPSLALQQHRMSLQRQKRDQDLKEQREQEMLRNSSPAKKKGSGSSLLCAKKTSKRKRINSPFKRASERFDITPYEEMALYYPQANQRRPLILVGPPSIGRHELRLRLLEDTSRFAAAVPHTSRAKGESEIDGQDYNFVSRAQFEEYASSPAGCRFVEHGEYDKQYYGTSLDAVRTVINSGKICVLNLQPSSLKILHESDLKPYVVFLTPPTLQTYRQQKAKYGEQYKEEEFRDSVSIAQEMEDNYGHYFDSVIPFDDVDYVYQQLMYEINLLEREPQWVPAKWVAPSVNSGACS